MLFRTKFLFAFVALGAVAIATAALLIVSSQRNEVNQQRSQLAHESLSGYFQLSGAIFRTFKQTRRDLISGPGRFAFDFEKSAMDITDMLDQIEQTLIEEAAVSRDVENANALDNLAALRAEVVQALTDIQAASDMIVAGQLQEGRQKAIDVLQGQVDVNIATLIEQATNVQRAELARAQDEIRAVQQSAETTAWVAMTLTILLSGLIFTTLLRRFQTALRALDAGAKAYTANRLDHEIDLPGQDELSDVARGFTDMAQQMQVKQQTIETARQELEKRVAERTRALSSANDALRQSDAQRRQFFADIGHELRTPVSAIRGEAEVALRSRVNRADVQQAALKTIVTIADELTAGVNDLFLIAREMAGVLDFRTEQIVLNHAVSLGIEQIQSLSGQKHAVICIQHEQKHLQIIGETSRIAQLVRILMANALEHGQKAVRIEVTLSRHGTDALLRIADNGPGIPETDWPRIFDRFVKGSQGNAHRASGTGLGLAIAKSIVMAHGGSISVGRSTIGGAEFIARFPCVQEPVAE